MGRKKKNEYVNNRELREQLVYYILNNPNDNGEWLEKWYRTVGAKGKKFYETRKKQLANRQYNAKEFNEVSTKFFKNVYKIAEGIIAAYRLVNQKVYNEYEDIVQECVLTVAQYCNRYDTEKDTSALAYLTQLCKNALNAYLKHYNDSQWCRQEMPEWDQNSGFEDYYDGEEK